MFSSNSIRSLAVGLVALSTLVSSTALRPRETAECSVSISYVTITVTGSSTTSSSSSISTTSSSTTSASLSTPSSYMGCWTEQPNIRTLLGTVFYDNAMTVEECVKDCSGAGYLLAGVEYSRECWCGNSITQGSVQVPDASCAMPCDGNPLETCGGPSLLNIYQTDYAPVAAVPVVAVVAGVTITTTSSSTVPYSGPTTVPTVGSCYFVGCYSEGTNSRALIDAHDIDYNGMTVEKCGNYCGGLSYSLFGVEWSGECYCGNTLQAGSVLMPIDQCVNICDGDSTEYCGGSARLGLYYCPPIPTTFTAIATITDFIATAAVTSAAPTDTVTVDIVTVTSTTTVATVTSCIPGGYVDVNVDVNKRQLENGLTLVSPTSTTETLPFTEYLTSFSTTTTTPFATFTPTTTSWSSVTYTSNVCPTPSAACNNQGLQWAYYDDAVYNNDVVYSQFDPTVYKTQIPQITGVTSTLGGINTDSNPIVTLYGQTVNINLNYFALNHVGYIFAPLTGTYTFNLPCPDDIDFVWLGASAFSGYSRANAFAFNDYGTYAYETWTVDLVAGTYTPIRIMFAQAQGPARFELSLTDPSGSTMLSSDSSQSPFLVQYSCDGVTAPRLRLGDRRLSDVCQL